MGTPTHESHEGRFPTIDEKLLSRICSEIAESFDPRAVVVIGSAARNEAHEQSDVDLVVVTPLDADETTWERARKIHRLFRGWRVPMDIIVLTPQEFRCGRQLPGHIARTAINEGRMLYERSA